MLPIDTMIKSMIGSCDVAFCSRNFVCFINKFFGTRHIHTNNVNEIPVYVTVFFSNSIFWKSFVLYVYEIDLNLLWIVMIAIMNTNHNVNYGPDLLLTILYHTAVYMLISMQLHDYRPMNSEKITLVTL